MYRSVRPLAACPRGHPKKKPCGFTALQTRAAPCVYPTRLSRPSGAYANCPRGPPKRSLMVLSRPKRVPPREFIPPGFRAHQARARLACGGLPKEALWFHRAPNACRPVLSISPGFRAHQARARIARGGLPKEALWFYRAPNACRPVCLSHQAFAPIRRVRGLPAGASQKKPCGFTEPQTRAAPCVYLTRLSRP